MKKQQEHIRRILEGKKISYTEVDVCDPNYKKEKKFMKKSLKLTDQEIIALPPQIFNDKQYIGVCTSCICSTIIEKVLRVNLYPVVY